MSVKGIKAGTVVLGKIRYEKAGLLPSNIVLVGIAGEVDDLKIDFNWLNEPIIFETDSPLDDPKKVFKAISKYGRSLPNPEDVRRIECVVDAMSTAYQIKILKSDDHSNVGMILPKRHHLDLGDHWV